MKHTVRHPSLLHTTALSLPGIAGAVVCVAQIVMAVSGDRWSPVLACATGVIAVIWLSGVLGCGRGVSSRLRNPDGVSRWSFSRVGCQAVLFVLCSVWWTSVWVCCTALLNVWTETDKPLEGAAVVGAVIGVGMFFVADFVSLGRLKGVIFAPTDFKGRRSELARQREEILATARQNGMN